MDVTCSHCQGKFKIPDDKLPPEQVVAVACPRCKNKITIDTRSQNRMNPAAPSTTTKTYDLEDKAFDFIDPGTKTALLCESNVSIRTALSSELTDLGYYVVEVSSASIALRKMRFHVFNVLVISDTFNAPRTDTQMVLDYLGEMLMGIRRNLFVILLSDQFRTMDSLTAFNKNVNLIVNKKNLNDFSKICLQGLADYQAFYRVFQESLTKTGKD